MNKSTFIMLFAFFIFISTVSATNVAYITKFDDVYQQNPINELERLGISYEIISEDNMELTNFEEFDLIIIEDGSVRDAPVNQYPSLIMDPSYYESFSGSIASSTADGAYNLNHPITEGTVKTFDAYNQNNIPIYYLTQQKYSIPATVRGNSFSDQGKYVIAVKNNPRRVFFGIVNTEYWTNESKVLFERSISWILNGDDIDNDGFYSDFDCNNSNRLIYPGAPEIPYNDIDEDCNGFDLIDVDNDSFVSEVVGGNDCDDYDSTVNIDSEEKEKNCVNDEPLFIDFNEYIEGNENSRILIELNLYDPEKDQLTLEINDSRFKKTEDKDEFYFDSGYFDSGLYNLEISVTDNDFITKEKMILEILNVNQKPYCDTIPQVTWNEDSEYLLNLSQYCYDYDKLNDFKYSIYSTSDEDSIILKDYNESQGTFLFSASENWNGKDWIQFKVKDSEDFIITEIINLTVNEVNDLPQLIQNFSNISLDEDTKLIKFLNLNDFFFDNDNENLIFSVTELEEIEIIINDEGYVSIEPLKDIYGQFEIMFSAKDSSENNVYSNKINLTVNDLNEPPIFDEIICQTEIIEDEMYECNITGSDFESDEFDFRVKKNNGINCEFNENNTFVYYSENNYNGNSNCEIEIYDQYGSSTKLVEFYIENVNDGPEITNYLPELNDHKILEGDRITFSIKSNDIDSDELNYSWFVNSVLVAKDVKSYTLKEDVGSYNVKAVVNDSEYNDSVEWNVVVGDISQFTCSEVNGFVCSENEYCSVDTLGVSGSNVCCPVECSSIPPEFNNVPSCFYEGINESSKLIVEIEDPESKDRFEPKQKITSSIKVKNKDKIEYEVDLFAYLYDLDNDDLIEKDKETLDLKKNDQDTIDFSFEIPDDAIQGEYSIIAYAVTEDELLCSDEYVVFDVERDEEDVIIKDYEISKTDLCLGDNVFIDAKIKNEGSEDQEDLTLSIESNELGINEKSEEFELDEFDSKDDDEKIGLSFNIPQEGDFFGEHDIKLITRYEGGSIADFKTIKINIEDCSKPKSNNNENNVNLNKDIILLNEQTTNQTENNILNEEEVEEKSDEDENKGIIFATQSYFTDKIKTLFSFLF